MDESTDDSLIPYYTPCTFLCGVESFRGHCLVRVLASRVGQQEHMRIDFYLLQGFTITESSQ